jgi:hypothetical protein
MVASPTSPTERSFARKLPIPIAMCAVLVALGILSTVWADREEKANDPAAITAALQRAPITFGEWEGRDETANLPDLPPGKIGPTIVRRYVSRKTGEVILTYLTAGQPGPMLVNHQPTDCYPAIGYILTGAIARHTVPLEGRSAEFLAATFTKTNGPAPLYMRVLWSFSGTGDWEVPKAPRVAFARFPTLYKVYVIRQPRKPDEPLADDPSNEFIRAFLPALRKSVFSSQ